MQRLQIRAGKDFEIHWLNPLVFKMQNLKPGQKVAPVKWVGDKQQNQNLPSSPASCLCQFGFAVVWVCFILFYLYFLKISPFSSFKMIFP